MHRHSLCKTARILLHHIGKLPRRCSGHLTLMPQQCDLHMPNKDGYQACKEIRRWEKKNSYRRHPIIALSANVLGDVYAKCVEAGFNSYVTKPVAFKELSLVMTKFVDPLDPSKPPELMKIRKS